MINQKHCPFCRTPAAEGCEHLALAAEGRDFVRSCVEKCQGQAAFKIFCERRHQLLHRSGDWSPEQEDFTWLETAFCDVFLKNLSWFGGMDYEWRSGPKPEHGGFWVLMWSKDPQHLWWELREEFERRTLTVPLSHEAAPWLIWLSPR